MVGETGDAAVMQPDKQVAATSAGDDTSEPVEPEIQPADPKKKEFFGRFGYGERALPRQLTPAETGQRIHGFRQLREQGLSEDDLTRERAQLLAGNLERIYPHFDRYRWLAQPGGRVSEAQIAGACSEAWNRVVDWWHDGRDATVSEQLAVETRRDIVKLLTREVGRFAEVSPSVTADYLALKEGMAELLARGADTTIPILDRGPIVNYSAELRREVQDALSVALGRSASEDEIAYLDNWGPAGVADLRERIRQHVNESTEPKEAQRTLNSYLRRLKYLARYAGKPQNIAIIISLFEPGHIDYEALTRAQTPDPTASNSGKKIGPSYNSQGMQ